jgi:ABC-type multidrug transport system ATPase subunit
VGGPKLLILDEPTTGLDPDAVNRVFAYIQSEAEAGAGAIISTHDTSRFASVCDRVVALQKGRIIADLSRDNFMSAAPASSNDLWIAYQARVDVGKGLPL